MKLSNLLCNVFFSITTCAVGLGLLAAYNRLPKGCHFAAWERPELFVTELRAALKSLR